VLREKGGREIQGMFSRLAFGRGLQPTPKESLGLLAVIRHRNGLEFPGAGDGGPGSYGEKEWGISRGGGGEGKILKKKGEFGW